MVMVRPDRRGEAMQFSEIVAPTIKELFIKRMEDLILSGRLQQGDRLPSERELAEQMRISKTIAHAGIVDMQRMGFLEVVPRKGIFVGNYAENGTLEMLASIMNYNGGKLDSRNARSILEVRLALEGLALEAVAKNRSEETLRRLREIIEEAEDLVRDGAEPDYQALALLHFKFHHYICVASGNTISPLIFNAFKTPSLAFWEASTRVKSPRETVERLRRYYDLIEQRDGAGAIACLRQIIAD